MNHPSIVENSLLILYHSFLFSFFTPYLLNAPYADLGGKVGFIFGALAICSFFFAYFCVPEMKGRSLEEINEMFDKKIPTRQFRNYVLEHRVSDKVDVIEMEKVPADRLGGIPEI